MLKTPVVLVTSFNVRTSAAAGAGEEWLRRRLPLFKTIGFPSVASQSVLPDRWLVLCDVKSPPWFRDEIDMLASKLRCMTPAWLDVPVNLGRALPELVANHVSGDRVITARMDSDDGIATNFVSELLRNAPATGSCFINFTDGLQYGSGVLYRRSDPSNAFIGLSEPFKGTIMSVFVDWHTRARLHAPVKQVAGAPMWLQVVHGENEANELRGIPTTPDRITRFSVELPLRKLSHWQLALLQTRSVLALGTRVIRSQSRIRWACRVAASHVSNRIRKQYRQG